MQNSAELAKMQRVILGSWFIVLVGQWQLNNTVTLHAGWTQLVRFPNPYCVMGWGNEALQSV